MTASKDFFAMNDDELEQSFERTRRTHDRIQKWGARGMLAGCALAVVAGVAGIFTFGATTALTIFAVGFSGTFGSLGLFSLKRDDCAMDMRSMISAKQCRVQIGEAQQQRAAQESLRRMQDQFNNVADGKGLDADINVKGPLRLKARGPSFLKV